jgi:hypothetical protein
MVQKFLLILPFREQCFAVDENLDQFIKAGFEIGRKKLFTPEIMSSFQRSSGVVFLSEAGNTSL